MVLKNIKIHPVSRRTLIATTTVHIPWFLHYLPLCAIAAESWFVFVTVFSPALRQFPCFLHRRKIYNFPVVSFSILLHYSPSGQLVCRQYRHTHTDTQRGSTTLIFRLTLFLWRACFRFSPLRCWCWMLVVVVAAAVVICSWFFLCRASRRHFCSLTASVIAVYFFAFFAADLCSLNAVYTCVCVYHACVFVCVCVHAYDGSQ